MAKDQVTNKKLKSSGILFSVILSIFFIVLPIIHSKQIIIFPLTIIFYILFISITQPNKLIKPYLIWMKFGDYLGRFNTNILLSIFFFVAIIPASLIRNLIKLIGRNKKRKISSYYIDNNQNSTFLDEY